MSPRQKHWRLDPFNSQTGPIAFSTLREISVYNIDIWGFDWLLV